jgi:TPR repeat protein
VEETEEFLKSKIRADIGFYEDCVNVAREYGRAKEIDQEYIYLKKGMEFGDLHSQHKLAKLLLFNGVYHNPKYAFELLEDAVQKGHLEATVTLGEELMSGYLVPRDTVRAFGLFKDYSLRVAALSSMVPLGNLIMITEGCTHYGVCLAAGIGCKKNPVMAFEVLADLARRGFFAAKTLLESREIDVSMRALVYEGLETQHFDGGTEGGGPVNVQDVFTQETANWNLEDVGLV